MAVIEGGNVIAGGVVMEATRPGGGRTLYGHGAPTAGVTYDGVVAAGDLYFDLDNGNTYEFTTGPDAYTRVDTV